LKQNALCIIVEYLNFALQPFEQGHIVTTLALDFAIKARAWKGVS
jgi:hypothetical protein